MRSGFEQKCNLSILLALRENILSALNNMKDFSPLFSQHGGGEVFLHIITAVCVRVQKENDIQICL